MRQFVSLIQQAHCRFVAATHAFALVLHKFRAFSHQLCVSIMFAHPHFMSGHGVDTDSPLFHLCTPMQLSIAESAVSHSYTAARDSQCSAESCDEAGMPSASQVTSLVAETKELKGQVEQLRAERTRWMETQRRMMELLHTTAPEKLVHDLRNLLNERDLLKTLVDQM